MILFARDGVRQRGEASVDSSTRLGRGATASVYPARLDGVGYAAKIFNEDAPFPTAKILAMLANPPRDLADQDGEGAAGRLAWPIAILSDEKGRDVGFLMPAVDLSVAFPLDYFYDQILFKRLKSPIEAALSFKLEIARNLSRLIADLHEQGHCFIDMKPQNIRVTRGAHEVCLLDCDGFSITGPSGVTYPAELLSTDYISPEAFRGNTPPSALGEAQDRYALAVLLFQLLNRGTHPFQGIPRDTLLDVATNDEKAAQGLYPHGLTPHPRIKPRTHSIHEQFEDGLRALFDQAFVGSPSVRPTAKNWASKFDELLAFKSLVRCDDFPSDVSHMRFRDKACPACYLAAQTTVKVAKTARPIIPSQESKASASPNPLPNRLSSLELGDLVIFSVIAGLIVLFILMMSSNSTEAPAQKTLPRFFSLYISDNRSIGASIGKATLDEADSEARSLCAQRTPPADGVSCKRVASGQARCLSIATSGNGAAGFASGYFTSDVTKEAINNCISSGGIGCRVQPINAICEPQ